MQQHPYWDSETGCPFAEKYGHNLSDYATPQEVTALITALRELYRELGRKLRDTNLRIKPSVRQQRGEGQGAWYHRFRQLPPEDQVPFHEAGTLQIERSEINDLLAKIREDGVPRGTRHCSHVLGPARELVAPFVERYETAAEAAREQWEQECSRILVDDAAWEKELQLRAAIDRQYEERQQ